MPVDAPLYPVNLVLGGRPVLVVGGGGVAARKVAGLRACDADVTVVAPRIVAELADDVTLTLHERPYERGEVAGYVFAVAATDDPEVNGAVFADGEAAGVWVNAADDPAHCSATLPAVVRRGPLLVTVSTSGHSPALASWLRGRFERELGPEYQALLTLVAEERAAVRATGASTLDLDWQRALDSEMLELIRAGDLIRARERLRACLSSS